MPRLASEIVTRATQIAKAPGMTVQAGQILNEVLQELAQTYDLAINYYHTTITITPATGSGPYSLPSNYLRAGSGGLTYTVNSIPFVMVQITLAEYDLLIQQSTIASYPDRYVTDLSNQSQQFGVTGGVLAVYPPPLTTISVLVRYYIQPVDIITPETSASIPWFPNDTYLIRRVAGELMAITGDPRADAYLGDGPAGCLGILRRFLELQSDNEGTGKSAILDPRKFGRGGAVFPPSKLTGGV